MCIDSRFSGCRVVDGTADVGAAGRCCGNGGSAGGALAMEEADADGPIVACAAAPTTGAPSEKPNRCACTTCGNNIRAPSGAISRRSFINKVYTPDIQIQKRTPISIRAFVQRSLVFVPGIFPTGSPFRVAEKYSRLVDEISTIVAKQITDLGRPLHTKAAARRTGKAIIGPPGCGFAVMKVRGPGARKPAISATAMER